MKHSNVVPSKISVQIYDGLKYICGSDSYTSTEEARAAAQRIIEHQKKLMGSEMTAYAMVFENRKMLYYFD